MSAPEVELRRAWQSVVGEGSALPQAPPPAEQIDTLLASHREPHRRYHTATHVMWVIRHLHALEVAGQGPADMAATVLAALYHDAVYDTRASDNEARSAALATDAARSLGWTDERCALVHRLVMATAAHQPADAEEAALVDADLAILGASPGEYAAYISEVRAEYAHVPEAAWRAGRAAVLRSFLAMDHIYTTKYMRQAREGKATANITAELATLTR